MKKSREIDILWDRYKEIQKELDELIILYENDKSKNEIVYKKLDLIKVLMNDHAQEFPANLLKNIQEYYKSTFEKCQIIKNKSKITKFKFLSTKCLPVTK